MPVDAQRGRDLVVNPGEYVFMQDTTKGVIRTYVGPTVINQTGQDQPVVFRDGRFFAAESLEKAVQRCPRAEEGEYIVLKNPASGNNVNAHPAPTQASPLPDLKEGCEVNVPGPVTFALFPGQSAKTIPGHHLRSNQYLVVMVRNQEQARTNWASAIMTKVDKTAPTDQPPSDPVAPVPPPLKEPAKAQGDQATAPNLVVGQKIIIPGTSVSFYIPPTGIEVVGDDDGKYVRDAVTLERLEYAVLVDENGNKRYEKGPQVVFPSPTEEFQVDRDDASCRKFRAIELNPIQGVLLKCIAACDDPTGKTRKEGDEFFLTGKECPIFYPQPELQVVQYGDRVKHFAVAVPPGSGRYVMNRMTGQIRTEVGPKMLLPDPTSELLVRRVLGDKEINLWYPDGASAALTYNHELASAAKDGDETTRGYVSESSLSSYRSLDISDVDSRRRTAVPDSFKRGTTFSKPREITIDDKYQGVPVVCVFTGYAIMVVSKTGARKVVVGPKTHLVGYDETLEVLSVSTGKPKNSDKLLPIVYMRVVNNKVSDIIEEVQTSDHVALDVKLSFRVDFTGEPEKWFEVENYVKFLCDHVRSLVKGSVRKHTIDDFYSNGCAIIRDTVLGTIPNAQPGQPKPERPGLVFKENGMRVVDVEVLTITIKDAGVKKMLEDSQVAAVRSGLDLAGEERKFKVTQRMEDLKRLTAKEIHGTTVLTIDLASDKAAKEAQRVLLSKASDLESLKADQKARDLDEASSDAHLQHELERVKIKESQLLALAKARADQELAVRQAAEAVEIESKKANDEIEIASLRAKQELRLAEIAVEAKSVVDRMASMQGGMTEALLTLSSRETLTKIAEATSVQRLVGGKDVADVLGKVFAGTPLEGHLAKLMETAGAAAMAGTIAGSISRQR